MTDLDSARSFVYGLGGAMIGVASLLAPFALLLL